MRWFVFPRFADHVARASQSRSSQRSSRLCCSSLPLLAVLACPNPTSHLDDTLRLLDEIPQINNSINQTASASVRSDNGAADGIVFVNHGQAPTSGIAMTASALGNEHFIIASDPTFDTNARSASRQVSTADVLAINRGRVTNADGGEGAVQVTTVAIGNSFIAPASTQLAASTQHLVDQSSGEGGGGGVRQVTEFLSPGRTINQEISTIAVGNYAIALEFTEHHRTVIRQRNRGRIQSSTRVSGDAHARTRSANVHGNFVTVSSNRGNN